jgi:hypothetical protein
LLNPGGHTHIPRATRIHVAHVASNVCRDIGAGQLSDFIAGQLRKCVCGVLDVWLRQLCRSTQRAASQGALDGRLNVAAAGDQFFCATDDGPADGVV